MKLYQDEYNRKLEERYRNMDRYAWTAGEYIISAVQKALDPKKAKYPKKPFMENREAEGSTETEIAAINFNNFVNAFNQSFNK